MADAPAGTAVERAPAPELTSVELADRARQRRATQLAKAVGLLPKPLQNKAAEVYLILEKSAGLGIPEGEGLANFYPIEGRLVPSAQLQAALVRRAGHRIGVVEQSSDRCVVKAKRREDPAEDTLTVIYSLDDAKRAGLLDEWVQRKTKQPGDQYESTEKCTVAVDGVPVDEKTLPEWARAQVANGVVPKRKENWYRYRQDMLRARAIAQAARSLFSDCLLGIGGAHDWTDEEVERAEARAQAQQRQEDEPENPEDDVLDAELVDEGEGEVPPTAEPSSAPSGGDGAEDQLPLGGAAS